MTLSVLVPCLDCGADRAYLGDHKCHAVSSRDSVRLQLPQNPRFAYQGIRGRPDFAWPGNRNWRSMSRFASNISLMGRASVYLTRRASIIPIPITGAGVNMATGSALGDC